MWRILGPGALIHLRLLWSDSESLAQARRLYGVSSVSAAWRRNTCGGGAWRRMAVEVAVSLAWGGTALLIASRWPMTSPIFALSAPGAASEACQRLRSHKVRIQAWSVHCLAMNRPLQFGRATLPAHGAIWCDEPS